MAMYPSGDWPDWFRGAADDAVGLLRTHFRRGMDEVKQRLLLEVLDESHEGMSHNNLVAMFEKHVRNHKNG